MQRTKLTLSVRQALAIIGGACLLGCGTQGYAQTSASPSGTDTPSATRAQLSDPNYTHVAIPETLANNVIDVTRLHSDHANGGSILVELQPHATVMYHISRL